jgi:hypothetical protein
MVSIVSIVEESQSEYIPIHLLRMLTINPGTSVFYSIQLVSVVSSV